MDVQRYLNYSYNNAIQGLKLDKAFSILRTESGVKLCQKARPWGEMNLYLISGSIDRNFNDNIQRLFFLKKRKKKHLL